MSGSVMLRRKICACLFLLLNAVVLFMLAINLSPSFFNKLRNDNRAIWFERIDQYARRIGEVPKATSLSFSSGYAAVLRMQNNSMFFIQKETFMPLMRLADHERGFPYRVRMGKQWMRGKAAVLVATVRNAQAHLSKNIAEFHKLGKLFKDYWIIFVENDSTDGTRHFLYDHVRQNYNQTIILGCEPINSRDPCHINITYRTGKLHRPGWGQERTEEERMDRGITMSVLRNMYLDYIYDNLADKAEIMIAIEPDLLWNSWNMDNIAQGIYYFSAKPKLDTLCANSRQGSALYDPCARTYFSKKRYISVTEYDHSIITDDIAMNRNSIPVKVESCFQAFAAYRISSLVKDRLHHYPVPDEWSCEHNTLARRLREIYIDPGMKLIIQSLFPHN